MMRMIFRTGAIVAIGALLSACGDAPQPVASGSAVPAQSVGATATGDLKYKAPPGWVVESTTSSMRAAQYRLPRAEGDDEDASLVLYYFGPGQGGSVEANLDRWVGQMEQPDGRPSKDKARSESATVNGLKVTSLDVTGTYTAEMSPGSGSRQNRPDYRLRAAVIETPKGPYFVKLVGPEKTVKRWETEFKAYIDSFEFK
ncbi:MAG TPA: hypothetical protein VJH03_25550 [Blastocatellia bacterium]|nr:hypothetical protein [Blastocatellia bacterium]